MQTYLLRNMLGPHNCICVFVFVYLWQTYLHGNMLGPQWATQTSMEQVREVDQLTIDLCHIYCPPMYTSIYHEIIQLDNCIILGSDLFFVLPRGLHVFLKTLDILTPESILRKQKIRNHVKVVHESNALHCQSTFLLQNFNLPSCAELL